MFKKIFTHKILYALAKDHGVNDFTVDWLSFDAVVFPSGEKGFAGKARIAATDFTPTVFTFVADTVDWKLSV